ncbi:MAG: hypothetical protein JRN26_04980 [Nitrososphaerota archaeon]|jgi:tRNA U34 2-thiouridine synthase MnmA/TrmU|nr:hypothetical protein [Nitrososphaerota archaeon]MDG6927560.1 hypothetical protein [Nitrososphaerota archaeon]MDG6930666.1 hypothetical protein [Nitrososphaerota archaeon]MDG6932501.1 hypothetical protein [Nitrososphaerota archaeon]MDG6936218.1 hypothetical protein [Nitrososphaerota archaeon]
MKAVALVSGGLDSILAMKIVQEMGIDVIPLHIITPFNESCCSNLTLLSELIENQGLKLETVNAGMDYVEMVKKPKFGYGSAINPCRDCRAYMLKKAKEIMDKEGANFIVTGEVLDQRPMSQNKKAMMLVEKEMGLEGTILRPLSGKILPPTIPEQKGLVDRYKMLDIKGRSRKRQAELARKLGLNDWPNSAGGCLLTDQRFALKLKDLFKHKQSYFIDDISILKVGRHFRLSKDTKLVIGRNEKENQLLSFFKRFPLLMPVNFNGPTGVLDGNIENAGLAASIVYSYSDKVDDPVIALCTVDKTEKIIPQAISREMAKKYLIINHQ